MTGREPVVVAAARTAQGKAGGVFADTRPEELSIPVVNELLADADLDGADVDDLQWGCVRQVKEQGNNLARIVALLSDLGESVPATTVDRMYASSATTIMTAADAIRAGQRDVVMAGGVESMSRVERDHQVADVPGMWEAYDVDKLTMGMTAETVAERYGISREEQDAYGARSQQRAVEATEAGRFDEEIVPVSTEDGTVDEDEGLRPGTTAETLADLPPAFVEGGTLHAGNASQRSDGAAGLLLTSRAFAEDHGLDPLAGVGHHDVAGVDPEVMGIGPVPAVEGLLERAGRTIDDYGLVELNEAFASQTRYCQRELGIPDDVFNVNGVRKSATPISAAHEKRAGLASRDGAIAIGHPLGAFGVRLPVTLVHEMRRRGVERGLSTMCVGYGQGAAVEFTLA